MEKDSEKKAEKTVSEKKIFSGFKVPRLKVTPGKVYFYILVVFLTIKLIFDVNGFGGLISGIGSFASSILSYLIVGFIIAFILNVYVEFLKRTILKRIKNLKVQSAFSVILAYLTFIVLLALLVFALIPALAETINIFAENIPKAFTTIKDMYVDVIRNGRFDLPEGFVVSIEENIALLQETMMNMFDVKAITETLTGVFTFAISGIFNVVMGLMVSVYMLLEKNKALNALRRINYAMFSKKRADNIQWGASKINAILRQYFAGKLLQAGIVLIVSYALFLVAGVRYAILLAVVMAIMNMIPYIGPWIGGIIVVFISIPQGLFSILATLVCVLAVQALDNWFITPKIVGGKMGISPLLVLIGLCIFGGIFGLPGMIFGDVMMAVVKVLFYDGYVQRRIAVKQKNGFLSENFDKNDDDMIERKPPEKVESENKNGK